MAYIKEFKEFLKEYKVLGLAIAFIIGGEVPPQELQFLGVQKSKALRTPEAAASERPRNARHF